MKKKQLIFPTEPSKSLTIWLRTWNTNLAGGTELHPEPLPCKLKTCRRASQWSMTPTSSSSSKRSNLALVLPLNSTLKRSEMTQPLDNSKTTIMATKRRWGRVLPRLSAPNHSSSTNRWHARSRWPQRKERSISWKIWPWPRLCSRKANWSGRERLKNSWTS